jgi:hypothetical protein
MAILCRSRKASIILQEQLRQHLQFLKSLLTTYGKTQNDLKHSISRVFEQKLRNLHSVEVELSGQNRDRFAQPSGSSDANWA